MLNLVAADGGEELAENGARIAVDAAATLVLLFFQIGLAAEYWTGEQPMLRAMNDGRRGA